MAENKKSFLFYIDWIHTFRKLPDAKRLELLEHLFLYVTDQNPTTNDLLIDAVFEQIKQTLKRDLRKYENIIERNRNNGQSGGRPKKEPKKPTGLTGNPKNPVEPKKADRDIVIDIDKRLMSEIEISDVELGLVEYFKIAREFQLLFIKNLKEKQCSAVNQEKATFKRYVNPIRLMIVNNECTVQDLRDVYDYLYGASGEFWKKNILSTEKLREQIQKLIMSARETKNKPQRIIQDRL